MTIPELQDDAVLLRGFVPDDAAAYAALNRDEENVLWAGSDPDMTEADALQEIEGGIAEGWRSGVTRRFAVEDTPDGALAGTVTFHGMHDGAASLGIKLTARARGRGVAARAVALMLCYGFDDCGLKFVHWHAAVGNDASRRLAERAGFSLEGTVRGFSHALGRRADGWILTLSAEEYRSGTGELQGTAPVVPVIGDGVVTLRAFEDGDAAGLVSVCRDPEVQRWTSVPENYTLDMALRHIRHVVPEWWRDGSRQVWAVVGQPAGEGSAADGSSEDGSLPPYLGSVNLHAFGAGTAEIGLAFGSDARGTGAAERAVRLLLAYAFDHLNLEFVHWRAVAGNWSSRKLAWKCGFSFDGELRGAVEHRGELRDVWCLSLKRGEPQVPRTPWRE